MSDGDTLTFLGDKDLSDYFDFVVPQDRVDRFFPALWEYLLADASWSHAGPAVASQRVANAGAPSGSRQ